MMMKAVNPVIAATAVLLVILVMHQTYIMSVNEVTDDDYQTHDPVLIQETYAQEIDNDEASRMLQENYINDEQDNCHLPNNVYQTLLERYRDIGKEKKRYFIAMNLHNSQLVIPQLSNVLVTLSQILGRESVFVSIYENGSNDHVFLADTRLQRF
jgi:Cryptococcal mannosyltransferase 1